jgi:hypothetical protein
MNPFQEFVNQFFVGAILLNRIYPDWFHLFFLIFLPGYHIYSFLSFPFLSFPLWPESAGKCRKVPESFRTFSG